MDYGDYVGWKSPFAKTRFSERQRWLCQPSAGGIDYTPQLFSNMKETREWNSQSAVKNRAQAANQQPVRTQINVSMSTAGVFTTMVELRFVVTEPGGTKRAPQGCEVLQVVAMSRCSRPKPNSEFLP